MPWDTLYTIYFPWDSMSSIMISGPLCHKYISTHFCNSKYSIQFLLPIPHIVLWCNKRLLHILKGITKGLEILYREHYNAMYFYAEHNVHLVLSIRMEAWKYLSCPLNTSLIKIRKFCCASAIRQYIRNRWSWYFKMLLKI